MTYLSEIDLFRSACKKTGQFVVQTPPFQCKIRVSYINLLLNSQNQDQIENYQNQLAVKLKRCTYDPMLVEPKCV